MASAWLWFKLVNAVNRCDTAMTLAPDFTFTAGVTAQGIKIHAAAPRPVFQPEFKAAIPKKIIGFFNCECHVTLSPQFAFATIQTVAFDV